MLLGRALEFPFDVNMFFMKLGLKLLTILKISVVKFLSLLIFIEVFLLFSGSIW